MGNGCWRLLLCSQPWPMLCITCCPGMCIGKCTRVHKTSNRMMGLMGTKAAFVRAHTHKHFHTLQCKSRVLTVMYFKQGGDTNKGVSSLLHALTRVYFPIRAADRPPFRGLRFSGGQHIAVVFIKISHYRSVCYRCCSLQHVQYRPTLPNTATVHHRQLVDR